MQGGNLTQTLIGSTRRLTTLYLIIKGPTSFWTAKNGPWEPTHSKVSHLSNWKKENCHLNQAPYLSFQHSIHWPVLQPASTSLCRPSAPSNRRLIQRWAVVAQCLLYNHLPHQLLAVLTQCPLSPTSPAAVGGIGPVPATTLSLVTFDCIGPVPALTLYSISRCQ